MNIIKTSLKLLSAALILLTADQVMAQSANPNDPNDFQYVFVEGGIDHTVALRCNGTVACWGDNSTGELGNNNAPTDSNTPVTVAGSGGVDSLTGIIAVAAGNNHTLALRNDGTVWTWGNNASGQLGDATNTQRNFPVYVRDVGGSDTLKNVIAIAAGGDHSLAILSNGTVVSWGENSSGQLGDGTKTDRSSPVAVTGMDAGVTAYAIAAGECHTMVLQSNGRVKTCGCDDAGQLGDDLSSNMGGATSLLYVNTDGSGSTPLENIVGIAAGRLHALAVASNGQVYSWGSQSTGTDGFELGRPLTNTATQGKYAGLVDVITSAVAVAAGDNLSVAMLADRTLMVWGDNDQGELGLGDNTDRDTPVANTLLTELVRAVGAGGPHVISLLENDSIKTWGSNTQGQLGIGSTGGSQNTPQLVTQYQMGIIVADAGPDTSYCIGDSVQIGGESPGDYANFRYLWTPTTGLTATGTSRPDTLSDPFSKVTSVTTTTTIDYILVKQYRTSTVAACINEDTVRVTVSAGVLADFTSNAPKCQGEAVDFLNTGSTGAGIVFSWDFGAGASPTTSTAENPQGIVYASPGLKKVVLRVADTSGCGDTATVIRGITIHEEPVASFTSSAPACEGASVQFTNTGTTGSGWMFHWDLGSGATPATSTAENPQNVVYQTPGQKTITFTISNGNCSHTSVGTIDILDAPEADFSSTAPVCSVDPVDFTNMGSSSAALSYSWNFGSGATPATSNLENPAGITYATEGLKAVSLTVSDGTCADVASQTIQIYETPVAGFTAADSVCTGSPVSITNTGTSGGGWVSLWSFGQDAVPANSTADNPGSVVYQSAGDKVITLTVKNSNCQDIHTDTIFIRSSPVADFASTAPECTGEDVEFSNTGSSGAGLTFSWTFGAGASPATSIQENPANISYSTAGNKTVTFAVSDGTCSDTATQSILIRLTPTVAIQSTAPACAGAPVDFSSTGTTGPQWSFSWSFGNGASPANSTAENPQGVVYASGGSKTITLSMSDGNCTNTDTAMINIYNLPQADAGKDTAICANDSVQIGSDPVAGFSYSWTPVSTLNNASIANPVAGPIGPVTIYQLTVTDNNTGCQNYDSVQVTMLGAAFVEAGPDAEICPGDSIQLGRGLLEGQSYSWSPAAGLNDPSLANPVASPDSTTVYTLSATFFGCDTITDRVRVSILPSPNADAGMDQSITPHQNAQLNASGGVVYHWSPERGLSNSDIFNPVASPDSSTTYFVDVTNIHGCTATDSVTITVVGMELFIPNTFTPDNTGRNDVFRVRGEELQHFEMRIFDRWGQQIFFTGDFFSGWNGTVQPTGEAAPQGAYVYAISGEAETREAIKFTGMVNLIR